MAPRGSGWQRCERLAAGGASVVAVGRDAGKSSDLPEGVAFEACDATDSAAVEALLGRLAPYDILISAATGGDAGGRAVHADGHEGLSGEFRQALGLHQCGALWRGASAAGWVHRAGLGLAGAQDQAGADCHRFGRRRGRTVRARRGARTEAPMRINTVAPGFIDTPMVPLQGQERVDLYTKMTAGHLIPRAGQPDELAHAILFAVENDFITGTTIDVDGGLLLS